MSTPKPKKRDLVVQYMYPMDISVGHYYRMLKFTDRQGILRKVMTEDDKPYLICKLIPDGWHTTTNDGTWNEPESLISDAFRIIDTEGRVLRE